MRFFEVCDPKHPSKFIKSLNNTMATLQKIRSKGALLLIVVGLALFAFIAEEFVRSLSSSQNESRQRIAKIYGESMNVQEYNDLVEEYTDVMKLTSGQDNFSEEQMQQMRDQVWNTYVQNQLLGHEAEELGLTVTDAEMQDIIQKGQNPMLMQTPFVNQQTRSFDVQALNKFLNDYKAMKSQPGQPQEAVEYYTKLYNYWKFLEKSIRQQTLAEKYQNLLGHLIMPTDASIKASFEARNDEKDVLLVAVPYSSIKDEDVKVDDSELQAKYDELKEAFLQQEGTRDIKYIDVPVVASKADRELIDKEMKEVAEQLSAADADIANVVRKSGSIIAYSPLPVRSTIFPADIAKEIDSLAVGVQKGPYVNAQDNSQNIVRLLAKVSLPDSIQFQQIGVAGTDAAAQKTADSIMNAIQAGAPFDSIAKKYNQTGAEQWLTSAQYEGANIDETNQAFIRHLNTQPVGTLQQVKLTSGIAIIKMLDKKNFVTKYDVAVVKRPIDFSNDTFNKTYNDFSQFVATYKTIEDIEANAMKAGYMVQQREDLYANEHNLANISSTREALRWVFNEKTKKGEISEIYTCGSNDHLLIVMLTGIHDGKYRDLESVKDFLKTEVLRDKKAAQIQEKMAACNDLAAAAKLAGALPIDTVKHITFNAPAFITSVGASEPALSGAVARTAKGAFTKGVKGNAAVYAFQVTAENKKQAKLDDAAKQNEKQQLGTSAMRAASRFVQELYQKANVKDMRNLFY